MTKMRKTKIICTLGPATIKGDVTKQLILNGMNVARFNFSHDNQETHKGRLAELRALSKELNQPVAALLDTKGPEIRVGAFEGDKVILEAGQRFTLTTKDVVGNNDIVSISYKKLPEDVQVGSSILIDDGLIGMEVVEIVDGTDIVCTVINGGPVSTKKGINIPGVDLSMPFVSEQDRADIIFGIENDFDFLAASFVRTAHDILEIRKIFEEYNCKSLNIIAKIENMQGVKNIDEIIEVSDGIMVARGDMGVEIPNEDVPVIQKMIIKKVYNAGKQVITATQMLDSMMKNPRPTRAETADVANAIYDGTSAIMLSGETAAGAYPVEAVKTMARIAERIEEDIDYKKRFFLAERKANKDITDAISHATVTTAHDLNAKAIVTVTKSGKTARMISRYRPLYDIIACSTSEKVCRQLNMSWGVTPLYIEEASDVFELFAASIQKAKDNKLLEDGNLAVITAGVPLGVPGETNMIKVQIVGENN